MTESDHVERLRRLLTTPEAAEYLGVTERFVRRLILERRVPFYKVGDRHVRLDPDDLDDFLAHGRVESNASVVATTTATATATATRQPAVRSLTRLTWLPDRLIAAILEDQPDLLKRRARLDTVVVALRADGWGDEEIRSVIGNTTVLTLSRLRADLRAARTDASGRMDAWLGELRSDQLPPAP